MNKFLNSVPLINLYSRWFKLYSSTLFSSMLKTFFKRNKAFKFCWVIYTKMFSRILYFITFSDIFFFFFDSTISFLIVHINILHHCLLSRLELFMTNYGNMLESSQSPKLLIFLLLCQPCRCQYYSIIDHCHIWFFICNFLLW